jgi:O-antigen/teichoic acid export membrane protein
VRSLLLIVAPIVGLLVVLSGPLFGLVFGHAWEEAGPYTQILAIGFAVRLVVGPVLHTLSVLERQAWLLAIDAAGVVLIVGALLAARGLGAMPEQAVMAYTAAMALTYAALFVSARSALKRRLAAVASAQG